METFSEEFDFYELKLSGGKRRIGTSDNFLMMPALHDTDHTIQAEFRDPRMRL